MTADPKFSKNELTSSSRIALSKFLGVWKFCEIGKKLFYLVIKQKFVRDEKLRKVPVWPFQELKDNLIFPNKSYCLSNDNSLEPKSFVHLAIKLTKPCTVSKACTRLNTKRGNNLSHLAVDLVKLIAVIFKVS